MVAGFVHGVLNTDNMNITGESFDYGPWRWLPAWDQDFTAAYFDHAGLYAFGRQPEALHWNCGQLAVALRALTGAEPLLGALNRFAELYMAAIGRRWCWRMGLHSRGADSDARLVARCEAVLREGAMQPDAFFHRHRGGRAAEGELAETLAEYAPIDSALDHDYWGEDAPESMLIDEVETLWSAIEQRDDWAPLHDKIMRIRRMGAAHGEPPVPQGHT